MGEEKDGCVGQEQRASHLQSHPLFPKVEDGNKTVCWRFQLVLTQRFVKTPLKEQHL